MVDENFDAVNYEHEPTPLINDIRPANSNRRIEMYKKLTSQYLIGKVAVGIFLMESHGDDENWINGAAPHTDRPQEVWSQIILGLNWMYDQAEQNGVNVSFWFDNGGYYESVPTDDEPIQLISGNDDYWIIDAMNYIGYGSGDHLERVFKYNNDLRSELGTDWAFSIFVADSWNDTDGMFADEDDDRVAYCMVWYADQQSVSMINYILQGIPRN